jgi:hypothetical protein
MDHQILYQDLIRGVIGIVSSACSLSDSKIELLIDWSYYAHHDVTEE